MTLNDKSHSDNSSDTDNSSIDIYVNGVRQRFAGRYSEQYEAQDIAKEVVKDEVSALASQKEISPEDLVVKQLLAQRHNDHVRSVLLNAHLSKTSNSTPQDRAGVEYQKLIQEAFRQQNNLTKEKLKHLKSSSQAKVGSASSIPPGLEKLPQTPKAYSYHNPINPAASSAKSFEKPNFALLIVLPLLIFFTVLLPLYLPLKIIFGLGLAAYNVSLFFKYITYLENKQMNQLSEGGAPKKPSKPSSIPRPAGLFPTVPTVADNPFVNLNAWSQSVKAAQECVALSPGNKKLVLQLQSLIQQILGVWSQSNKKVALSDGEIFYLKTTLEQDIPLVLKDLLTHLPQLNGAEQISHNKELEEALQAVQVRLEEIKTNALAQKTNTIKARLYHMRHKAHN